MFTLINRTRCQAHPHRMLDACGEEHLLVVVKASFIINGNRLASSRAEIALADRYCGEPTTSSLVAAGEVTLDKPRPDLLLSGNAYPTRPGGSTGLVSFRVGAWSKDALVFGDRVWTRGVAGLRPGAAQPFEAIPLVYERAFGGADLSQTRPAECAENPVGVGLVGCCAGSPLPNIEHPQHRLNAPGDRPPPRGFGPVPPHWQPRRGLHGTFDAAWQRTRMPLPPLDADPRAAQVAPPDQVYPTALRGGEKVEVRGVRPDGAWLVFHVPRVEVRVTVHDGHYPIDLPTVLDTLHVNAEVPRLDLTWRARISVHERLDEIEWVRVEATGALDA